jgi:hypothetical protein
MSRLIDLYPHESWFTEERPPFDASLLLDPWTLAGIVAVIGITVGWRWLAHRFRQPELGSLGGLGRLSPWVPRLLAVHAGVSLLAQAYAGTYLAPGLPLPAGFRGTLLALLEGLVGVWLTSGFRIRTGAGLLVLAGPLGMLAYGVVPILERIDLLGIGLFLTLLPPGPDREGAAPDSPQPVAAALLALRLMVGGSLVILAFTEKLARPQLAMAFLDRYPFFNLLRLVGLEGSDLTFVRLAGLVELLVGLLIMSGALPQLTIFLAGIPFNATLFFLGSEELIGHLPLYGAMLALLVYGSDRRLAPLTSVLRVGRVLQGSGGSLLPSPPLPAPSRPQNRG